MGRPVVIAHSDVRGGAEAYLTNLYPALVHWRPELEPTLLGTVPGWEETELDHRPLDLSPKWGKRTLLSGLRALPEERDQVTSALAGLDPSFVHVQFKREQVGFTEMLSPTTPVMWTEHGVLPPAFRRGPFGRAYAAASEATSAIICVSDRVAESVRRAAAWDIRIDVIENAVDTDYHEPPSPDARALARQSLGLAPDGPVALWAGRLAKSKRPAAAIEFARHWPGHVVIAGTGPESDDVEERAASVDNVVVVGHVDDMRPLYDAADVFLFTSTGAGEGLPTVFVEASAHGVPVLAGRRSGFGPMVEAMGGVVMPRGAKPKAWAGQAVELAAAGSSDQAVTWALERNRDVWLRKHLEVIRWVTGKVDVTGPLLGPADE